MKTPTILRGWRGPACLLLLLSLIAAGCRENGITGPGTDPNNPPPHENGPNILKAVQSNSELTVLSDLLEGTTLATALSGSGTKTLFAPSDAAFAGLDPDYLEGLDSRQRLDLLKYHVYSGSYPVINEIKREAISSLHGDPLFIEIGQSFGDLLNNRAGFDSTNIEATNGLVHIIDEVLVPDQYGSLAENIGKRYDYREFYRRLEAAGLVEYLQEAGTKTVLPASDMAMEWYEGGSGATLTDAQWKEIMQYHILELDFTVAGPGTKTALATLSGDSVYLTIEEPGQYMINGGSGNPVTVVNATNGKIISAGGIMQPDKFLGVLTIMDKRYYLQTARAALAVAKMTGRLYNTDNNADEKFTVFIPRNEAEGLNALPDDENELADILKYHVLLEGLTADQLRHNRAYTTWQGEQILISKNGDGITVNGSAVVRQSDLIGKNGVVHVIDRVLVPPAD